MYDPFRFRFQIIASAVPERRIEFRYPISVVEYLAYDSAHPRKTIARGFDTFRCYRYRLADAR